LRQEAAVQGTLLAAAISPDNTPHGYNLTFAFPMLMFIIIAAALFLRFRSPHRVPGHAAITSIRQASATGGETVPAAAAAAVTAVPEAPAASPANGDTTLGSSMQQSPSQESTVEPTAEQPTTEQQPTEQETTAQETTVQQTTAQQTTAQQTTEDGE
jgi:hypothetical protein